jgi:hypothetical protein
MRQPLPVIRQLYWPGLLPQFLAIAALSAVAWFVLPIANFIQASIVGAVIYLISCRLLRFQFTRDHILGMKAYRTGQFRDAITHFEASHRFFSAHRRLDAWRSLLLGVASYNPYRVIALGNMAWCYGQLGERAKAVELFEHVLQEVPDHAGARAGLNMLRASVPHTGAA